MSISSQMNGGDSCGVDSLKEIRARCREELTEERNMVKGSQSLSYELIRTLDLHVKTLTDSHSEDKMRIHELERELRNCSQEIDYLQDQLNTRETEVLYLKEQVHTFVPNLAEGVVLEDKVDRLRKELARSESKQLILLELLENKEVELQRATALIEKLEESLSSTILESQCEIESMKLDIMALEQNCFEANKVREKTVTERDRNRMNRSIQDLKGQEAQKTIVCLEVENKESRERLQEYETKARMLCQKFGEHLNERLEDKGGLPASFESFFCEVLSTEMSKHYKFSGSLLSQPAVVPTTYVTLMAKMDEMSHRIHEYELLAHKLKEDLRVERIKAKDEAEDLTQEMAELRYLYTGMLEEERNRRACSEQASLQRIAELEGQILKEEKKSSLAVRHLDET